MQKILSIIFGVVLIVMITACSNANANIDEPDVSENLQPAENTPATDDETTEITPAPEMEQEEIVDKQFDTLLEFALVGCWQASPGMPAGNPDRYVFFTNRTFRYYANQMNGAERLRTYSGYWHVDKGILILEVNRKTVIEGGEVIDGWGSMISDIEGGTYVKFEIDPPEVMELEIGDLLILDFDEISSRYYSHAFSLNIGDMTFWRYNFFSDMVDPDFMIDSNFWIHWEGDIIFE